MLFRARSIVSVTVLTPDRTEIDVILRDGSILRVREAQADDEATLSGLLSSLTPRSREFRFFSLASDVGGAAHRLFAQAGSRNLLAFAGDVCVAHACFIPITPDHAEVAFAVADTYQGRGVGSLLLGMLAESASTQGITSFEASVMTDNANMLRMFRESGFPTTSRWTDGGITIEMPTSFAPEALARLDARDQVATIASLALEDVILRVAALVDAHPEISELDANPVVVLEQGAVVVDARVRIDRRGSFQSNIGRTR